MAFAEGAVALAGRRRRRRTALSAIGVVMVAGAAAATFGLVGGGSHAADVVSPPPIEHTTDLTPHFANDKVVEDPHHEAVNPGAKHPVSVGRATQGGDPAFCVYNLGNVGSTTCGRVTPIDPLRLGSDVVAGVSAAASSSAGPFHPEGPLQVAGSTGTGIVRVDVRDASTGHMATSNAVGADLGLGISYFAVVLPTGTGPVTITAYDASGTVVDTQTKTFWPPPTFVDPTTAFVATGTADLQPDWPVKLGHTVGANGRPEPACSVAVDPTSRFPGIECYVAPSSARDFGQDPALSENAGHDPTKSTTLIQGSVGADVVRLTATTDDGRTADAEAIDLAPLCTCRAYGFHFDGYVRHVVLRAYDADGVETATWTITNGESLAQSEAGIEASASAASS